MCAHNTTRICITRISNKTLSSFIVSLFSGSTVFCCSFFINVAFIFTLIFSYRCEYYNLYFHDYRDGTWITQKINAANDFFFSVHLHFQSASYSREKDALHLLNIHIESENFHDRMEMKNVSIMKNDK